MNFELISPLTEIEAIAIAGRIREVERLRDAYGVGRWRKLKGTASVRLGPPRRWLHLARRGSLV